MPSFLTMQNRSVNIDAVEQILDKGDYLKVWLMDGDEIYIGYDESDKDLDIVVSREDYERFKKMFSFGEGLTLIVIERR